MLLRGLRLRKKILTFSQEARTSAPLSMTLTILGRGRFLLEIANDRDLRRRDELCTSTLHNLSRHSMLAINLNHHSFQRHF